MSQPAQLPEEVRAYIRQHLIDGASQTSIAKQVGCSTATVARISRALDAAGVERKGPTAFGRIFNLQPAQEARVRYTRDRQLRVLDIMLAKVEDRIAITNDARDIRQLAVVMGIAMDKLIALERLDAGLAIVDEQESYNAGDVNPRETLHSRIISIAERLRTNGDSQRAN